MGRQKRIESTARPSRPEAPNFPLRLAEAAGSFLRTRFNNAVHRAAESEIARLCEFRRLALDVADVGTWEHNIRTNEVTGDERARAIFGAPSTHLSFEEVIECSHPDDREKVRQAVARVLQPGSQGNYEMEHRVIWPDGSIKWVSVKGRVFFSDPGRKYPARFIGTVTDISARKRAEEAVKKTRDELAEISANLERTVEERTARLRETLVELEK
ncbi:MAG TPA: PAS domain-containing protein, partial [Verrucomicrobiae bacterium]|nr:PAS domain-containing protein [Verrucomicrobiae bacterium]